MTPCPDDDTLGALVERALDEGETTRVTEHLDECATCRALVIAAVRGGAGPALATGTQPAIEGAARRPVAIGAKIGRYQVRSLLGAGAMGHVYEAYDGELERAIALKVLRPELSGLTERLVRESRLMAKVSHPAVITVHDVGRDGDAVFIAMELIRGETLAAFVARARPPWREIVGLYERAGAGLAAAHKAGIVHRDFKPDNVLVESATGRVVVTDFGIARVVSRVEDHGHEEPAVAHPGSALAGTPAYAAPEQLAGTSPIDARADVFAFCVSLWESLFGVRPFPGKTVAEIRTAMKRAPVAPNAAGGAPRRLVRVLERGVAIDREARWPDVEALVRELAAVRARGRHASLVAGLAAVAGAGVVIAGALLRPATAHDPPAAGDVCARGGDALARSYAAAAVARALAGDAESAARFATLESAWRETQRTTCRADREPAQDPTTVACLDARRLELAGAAADLIDEASSDPAPRAAMHTRALLATIGDPGACSHPAPSAVAANVPDDAQLRRRVTALRHRIADVDDARNRGDFEPALAAGVAVVADAAAAWPRVHAEALYVLGTTQSQSGEAKLAAATFREAAAIAQAAHHDLVAANSWIELAAAATFDDGDTARGLEYLTSADAAAERLGRPPKLEALLEYVQGTTLLEANRIVEAETVLHHAVELAETTTPDYLPQALQALGFLNERKGRYADAVAAYRRAVETADETNGAVFRVRLAQNLALIGQPAEAEAEARRAVEISDRVFGPDSLDRSIAHSTLAQVLHAAGKDDAALPAITATLGGLAKTAGERSERYAEALSIEGEILTAKHRYADAATSLARACDIMAFTSGEDSTPRAQCLMSHALALSGAGRKAEALAIADTVMPRLEAAFGASHPLVASALVTRGTVHAALAEHAAAIADLQRAVAILETAAFDPGLLDSARRQLATERQAVAH